MLWSQEGKMHVGLGNLGVCPFGKKICIEQGLVQLEKFLSGLGLGKATFMRLIGTHQVRFSNFLVESPRCLSCECSDPHARKKGLFL